MDIISEFSEIAKKKAQDSGGKAYVLSLLSREKLPVPRGLVVHRLPEKESDWTKILRWWDEIADSGDRPKLAVRSSASGEDSQEFSFAGQQTTVLNVTTAEELKVAVKRCFDSVNRAASIAYRERFKKIDDPFVMNVLLQEMVEPQFAGVYFSVDPRDERKGWMVEVIEGLGEALVSGHMTPERIHQDSEASKNLKNWNKNMTRKVIEAGLRVKEILRYEVDMEWAIDQKGTFWVLQARPVTALHSRSNHEREVDKELKRLQKKYSLDTIWDGQTFSEWTGMPSYFTFSVWKRAFSPKGAFARALKHLGYIGSETKEIGPKDSLLERVFGRAYVNLSQLEPLFFGPSPYAIIPKPRPHLKFRWSKVRLRAILNAPFAMVKMGRVAWKLQTGRRKLLQECALALSSFKNEFVRPMDVNLYKDWPQDKLVEHLAKESEAFALQYLHWPFVLIIMAEATLQSLQAILARTLGTEKAEATIRRWLGVGLATITHDMNVDFQRACHDKSYRPFFFARFGHRGPGELDLSHPRWVELGDQAFRESEKQISSRQADSMESEFSLLSRFKRPIIEQEWKFLKEMLELRERWKMELMKPYAHLRWMALELGRRSQLGDDIFWLRLSEVLNQKYSGMDQTINDRKQRFHVFGHLSFPVVVTLRELESILSGNTTVSKDKAMEGEPLSPGVAYGEVRVVTDPSSVDTSQWPQDVILVAEATDPGWTPLFQHAKGIVVEKGGVLSHCAIVAREMGIPAVSGIGRAHFQFKNGDRLWVDGGTGRVTRS